MKTIISIYCCRSCIERSGVTLRKVVGIVVVQFPLILKREGVANSQAFVNINSPINAKGNTFMSIAGKVVTVISAGVVAFGI